MSDNQVTEPSETATPEMQEVRVSDINDLLDERDELITERDQLRAEVPELSRNYTDALSYIGRLKAELAKVQEERDKNQNLVKMHCQDWAEDDTAIKKLCSQFGISDCHPPEHNEFKSCVECVEELAAKHTTLTAALDKAREDSKRLDWLEANFEQVFQRISSDGFFYFDKVKERHERKPTLRAAIDAAKGAE